MGPSDLTRTTGFRMDVASRRTRRDDPGYSDGQRVSREDRAGADTEGPRPFRAHESEGARMGRQGLRAGGGAGDSGIMHVHPWATTQQRWNLGVCGLQHDEQPEASTIQSGPNQQGSTAGPGTECRGDCGCGSASWCTEEQAGQSASESSPPLEAEDRTEHLVVFAMLLLFGLIAAAMYWSLFPR